MALPLPWQFGEHQTISRRGMLRAGVLGLGGLGVGGLLGQHAAADSANSSTDTAVIFLQRFGAR